MRFLGIAVAAVAAAFLSATSAHAATQVLENAQVKFVFSDHDGVLSLAELTDKKTGLNFIEPNIPQPRQVNLWQLTLRGPDAGMTGVDETGEIVMKRESSREGETLIFRWLQRAIEDIENQIDVTMTVSLPKDSARAEWRIQVANRSDKYGVWILKFPRLGNLRKLAENGAAEFVAIPGGNGGGAGEGQLYQDPFETLHPFVRTYPCYHQSMQFNAYYGPTAGLYLATHDGASHTKGFLIQPGKVINKIPVMRYEVEHYPANAGVPGSGFEPDYPAVIGPFHGNWYDAARIYRAWALQQRWAKRGPLTKRDDISPWIRNGAYWMMMPLDSEKDQRQHLRKLARTLPIDLVQKLARHIDVDLNLDRVRKAHEYFGFPLLLWSNEWFDGGGDTSPPRYIPVNNLEKFLARLKQEVPDAHFSAHIQPKRFSVQLAEYDDAVKQSLETDYEQHPRLGPVMPDETYDQHAYPCWATDWWQQYWADKSFARAQLGIDGFHVDELGSATSFNDQCFNRAHPHPIGGGTLYADTRRRMVTTLRDNARRAQPHFAIHHEVLCEIYIDVADAAEVCTSPSNNNIPLYEAVYHDYNFIMGRRIIEWTDRNMFPIGKKDGDEGINEFVSSFAQTFIWGNQPGWTRIDIAEYAPRIAAVIKRFMDARYRAMKFLNVGDMMPPLTLTKPLPTVKRIWRANDTPEHVLPVVYNSVWKADDGTVGIVLANIMPEPQTIAYSCDLAACGLSGGKYKLTRSDTAQPEDLGAVTENLLSREDTIDGYSVKVIEVRKAGN